MSPKDGIGMANSEGLDQMADLGRVRSGSALFEESDLSSHLGSLW